MVNRYFIDGKDLCLEYGSTVLKSNGELDLPKPKKRLEIDWPDSHGLSIDAELSFVGVREIELECMLIQEQNTLAVSKLSAFNSLLIASGFRQMRCYKTNPKVHMVKLNDGIRVERFDQGKTLLFNVHLIEPEPVSRQFQIDIVTANDAVTVNVGSGATGSLTVYWGDGTKEVVVSSKTHSYPVGSIPIIVVAGDFTKTPNFSISAYINYTTVTPPEL